MTSRELLIEFRRAVGWAQPKLALELGVQVSTIKRWEASQEPPERRLALAIEALRQQVRREPERLGSRANQGVPTDLRPKCESCGSDMYKLGDPRTSSRWERRIQDYGCKRRWRRGKKACQSRRRVPYFVDSIIAGNPERVPEVHGWARGRPKQDVGFDRQLAHCPLKNCPRNQAGTFLYPGMTLAWKEPRNLKGYSEYGKVMKLRCWGSKKEPHKQVTAFWSYKLDKVVEVPDPYRGHKRLDWWEEKRGRDTCSECSSELRGGGTVKKGPMKGMRKKVCLSKKPHKGSKINYFDMGTGARRKAVVGRADLPENARICPSCGSNLKAGGRCIDHRNCHLMLCKNPLHRKKRHGSRQHHWDLQKKKFIPHTRWKELPQKARKVEIQNCPRCKKRMSWRMRKDHVQFTCPGCMRRYGQTWIIRVNFDDSERGRTKGRA